MRGGNILLAAAVLVAAPAGAHMSETAQGGVTCAAKSITNADLKVPFDVIDGRIYVKANVNGTGPYTFAIDTGASGMGRADASLTSALGLKIDKQGATSDGVNTATVEMAHFKTLELGGFARNDFDVIMRDYSSNAKPGAAMSGIIGREFFGDGLLIIDYPTRTLSFSRKQGLSQKEKGLLRYERAFRVPASIGDLQVEGHLDTGVNVSFVLPKALFDKLGGGTLEKASKGTLTNTQIETGRATIRGPFKIGEASLSDVEVRVSDRFPELLVGALFLQNFTVLIDQRSKSVAVCPNGGRP